MKALIQRVQNASVTVDGKITGAIEQGLLIFLGVGKDDTEQNADFLAKKCSELRMFNDENGKMNLSLQDIGGGALIVSQFTLYGDCKKGRRPSFTASAPPDEAERLYNYFVSKMKLVAPRVATGIFGADMKVELLNDGPVTFMLESEVGS